MIRQLGRRKWIALLTLSFLLTFLQISGWQISMKYGTTVHTSSLLQKIGVLRAPYVLLAGITEWIVWTLLLYLAFRFLDNIQPPHRSLVRANRLLWILYALMLLLCWLPALLGCFPGFYNYDIAGQLPQVMYPEVPFSTHHPLMHTLFSGGIITLGYRLFGNDLTMGVFLHSIVQMTICAVVLAHFIQWIRQTAKNKWLTVAAFLYYAFSPPIILFSMSTTKDVVCSVLLQAGILLLYESLADQNAFWTSRRKILLLFFALTMACLFRNNIIYAVAALAVSLLCASRKDHRLILLLVCVALSAFACNNILRLALKASRGSAAEAYSVPMQQLARVYVQESENAFKIEELEQLYQVIPIEALEDYNPFSADNIKNFTKFELVMEDKKTYFLLWLKKGLEYPDIYLMSFLENTYQAWYPGTSVLSAPKDESTYYFAYECREPISIEPKIPRIYEYYREISCGYTYQKYPVIRLFLSMGAMFWAALFTFFYGIWAKKKAIVTALWFTLLVCFTVFFGPVSLVRYYLFLFYALPVSAAFLAAK